MKPLDRQASLYTSGIGKVNHFALRPGVCILPLAEDPPNNDEELQGYSPVVIARLHAPYRIRKVSYDSNKVNNPPAGIPSPVDSGKFIFIGGTIGVVSRLNMSLTNFDWQIVTDYIFVENCVSRVEDGFVLGSYQAPTLMAQQNASDVGMNLFGQINQGAVNSPGAIASAGVDAQAGYLMGQSINFYGIWGYNQDSFLPGTFFNDSIINGDVRPG